MKRCSFKNKNISVKVRDSYTKQKKRKQKLLHRSKRHKYNEFDNKNFIKSGLFIYILSRHLITYNVSRVLNRIQSLVFLFFFFFFNGFN